MVSSGGIAAPSSSSVGCCCVGVGFFVSQSSREDRGRDIVIFFARAQKSNLPSYICDWACRREMQTGGMTCKHHFGGRGAAQPLLGAMPYEPEGARLPSCPPSCCSCQPTCLLHLLHLLFLPVLDPVSVFACVCGHVLKYACSSAAVGWSAPVVATLFSALCFPASAVKQAGIEQVRGKRGSSSPSSFNSPAELLRVARACWAKNPPVQRRIGRPYCLTRAPAYPVIHLPPPVVGARLRDCSKRSVGSRPEWRSGYVKSYIRATDMSSPRHILRLGPTNKSYVSVPHPSTDRLRKLGTTARRKIIHNLAKMLIDSISTHSTPPADFTSNSQLLVLLVCSFRINLLRTARQYRLGPN